LGIADKIYCAGIGGEDFVGNIGRVVCPVAVELDVTGGVDSDSASIGACILIHVVSGRAVNINIWTVIENDISAIVDKTLADHLEGEDKKDSGNGVYADAFIHLIEQN